MRYFNFADFSIFFLFLFVIAIHQVSAQTKSKEEFVFSPSDKLKKQHGIRLSDSTEFIIFDNNKAGYTEIYQESKIIWFSKESGGVYMINRLEKDTLCTVNSDMFAFKKNAKYQWVLGDGDSNGYFFKKGQIVLSVETIAKGRRAFVKLIFNEKDANIEALKIAALYKAHTDLRLNNTPHHHHVNQESIR